MITSDIPAHIAEEGTTPSMLSDHDTRARYEQAIRIGCLEMERITEEIIIPQFEQIGNLLVENGYDAEIIVFDSESPTENTVYLCGSGLRISHGEDTYALVFTGDPYRFQFNLQAHALEEGKVDAQVDYHRLTPSWVFQNIQSYLTENFPQIDLTNLESSKGDDWQALQGPFTIKMQVDEDNYNIIAITEDLDEATRMGSMFCSTFHTQDKVVLFDHLDRKVC